MSTPALYVCPVCEPGPYSYCGTIITKICSRCHDDLRNAKTGFDRERSRITEDHQKDLFGFGDGEWPVVNKATRPKV